MADAAKKKFSKEKLMKSKRFAERRDLIGALLDADKDYSIAEVEKMINSYFEREVK